MLKIFLRKEWLSKRLQLSKTELKDKTALILQQFNEFGFDPVRFLLSYYPLVDRNEFDVTICEQMMREKTPEIKVAWPKTIPGLSSMNAALVEKDTLFVKNNLNILEPLDGDIIPPPQLDMIFVPLVAFDNKGFRIGYGKGYYDRYLAQCRPDAIKLGFSYFEAVPDISDINDFDVPLNFCITPLTVYEF